ncbi:MAG: TonB-dependent receptor [Pseudomonadota bacterium]|nr:TonB-dependent receptor [Pseudomonadota bacterium]
MFVLSALMPSLPTLASESEATASEPQEITVTGTYSGSLKKAADLKRTEDHIVDAISAEDVGKFPSRNIGEALQRVPGVTLDRTADGSSTTRGEAVHINIRGLPPQFQVVQLNGRNIAVNEAIENGAKDGRQFRFDVLPSDVISLAEVVKSPTAALQEGGIAGNVDLRTYRPLEIGNRITASAKGNYGELANKLDGSYSGLGSWANQAETFGALLSGAYSTRHARQDRVYEQDAWLTGRDKNLFPNGDVFEPVRARPTIETEDRSRYTVSGSVQFRPNDQFETNFDGLWTRLNDFYKEYGIDLFLQGGHLRPGSYVVDADHTAISGIMDGVQLQLSDETSLQRHDLWSVGINQAWTPGDWKVVGDVNYSRADSDTIQPIQRARFIVNNVSVAYDFSRGYKNPPILTPNIDPTNPSIWTSTIGSLQARPQDAFDTDLETKFDVSRKLDGLITGLAAGVSNQRREHDYYRIDRNSPTFNNVSPAAAGPGSVLPLPYNNFLSGFASGYVTNWLDPNNAYLFSKYFDPNLLKTPPTALDLATQSHLNEQIDAIYGMASFGGTLGATPISGNIGVRVASTKQISSGYAVANGVATAVSFKKDYTDVLPSLNIEAKLRDDLIARFGASRAITRPNLSDIAPGLILATDINNASGGNPNLDPFRSKDLDLSLEWYFNSFGKLTGAGFWKDFDSYETAATTSEVIQDSKYGTYNVTTVVNGGTAKLTGLEMGYQQILGFLPNPLDGLGFEASYTYVSQSSSFTTGNRTVKNSLIGVSPSSYNVVGFYEKGPLAARVGYFWRNHYLARLGPANGSDEIFDAFGSVDGSLSYAITPHLTVTAEALNLADASVYSYASVKSRPQEIFHYGRTFSFGVLGKF